MCVNVVCFQQNRIDLKIDVPFTDHSHIIGRQGHNTQEVMKRTGCHIHFPDSNKNRENEKSNQVDLNLPHIRYCCVAGYNSRCIGSGRNRSFLHQTSGTVINFIRHVALA
jgi:hypothetical protein